MALQSSDISVQARSYNRSRIDVYLMCGDRDARFLGVVPPNESMALDFPSAQTRCVKGLNFFLVDRSRNHGYWVGPMHLQRDSRVDLVIERYAGLSGANLSRE
jgi:hypothetical protein